MLLVLLDGDKPFLDMVTSYVRASEYADRFAVKSFTTRESGFAFLEKTAESCLLVVHRSFFPLPDKVFSHPHGFTLFLSDTPVISDVLEYPVLFKYQPLNQLLGSIVSHHNAFAQAAPLTGRNRTQVTAVFSAAGSTGKSTVCWHLAAQLALAGQTVFYLNLELVHAASLILPASGKTPFEQALYYAKANPEQLAAKIGQLKQYHPVYKFDYIEPPVNIREMEEMTARDVTVFVDALVALGTYSHIVLDLESSLHPRIAAALERSDRIWWLVQDDLPHVCKTVAVLRALCAMYDKRTADALLGKAELIVNKHIGSTANSMEQFGLRVAGSLPYVPQWKSFAAADSLMRCATFQEHMLRLLQTDGGLLEVNGRLYA